MRLLFDTSALNWLHDDPEIAKLEYLLVQKHVVVPTAVNVAELAANPCSKERTSMLHLLRRISRNLTPLELPPNILREIALAHARGGDEVKYTVGQGNAGILVALNEPETIDKDSCVEASTWAREIDDAFLVWHREGRRHMQDWISRDRTLPFRENRAAFLRWCIKSDIASDSIISTYRAVTGTDLTRVAALEFSQSHPSWTLWLAAEALAIYLRGIQHDGFGSRNAGRLDLQNSVYLPFVDCFVTSDTHQYQAFRLLGLLNGRRVTVIHYRRLRLWLETRMMTSGV